MVSTNLDAQTQARIYMELTVFGGTACSRVPLPLRTGRYKTGFARGIYHKAIYRWMSSRFTSGETFVASTRISDIKEEIWIERNESP